MDMHIFILVVTPDEALGTTLGKMVEICQPDMYNLKLINVRTISLNKFLPVFFSEIQTGGAVHQKEEYFFDFIEYNGGVTFSSTFKEDMRMMNQVSVGLYIYSQIFLLNIKYKHHYFKYKNRFWSQTVLLVSLFLRQTYIKTTYMLC